MRVFFAIEFEAALKEQLFKMQQEVRKNCTAGNFTQKNNFHLTLRFIGEQTPDQVGQLKKALVETAEKACSFQLMLGKLGTFNKGNRKILWMGVNKSNDLDWLYKTLENTLTGYGYAKEDRPFSPHITLGREVRTDKTDMPMEANALIQVKNISLMESKRIDNILCYVPLLRIDLN